MSASLVGSEMCIRDRAWNLPWPWLAGGASWRAQGRLACPAGAAPPGSVSYTHLTLPTICSV
eukprot:516768-Alexandrium_andersonii.AAC.1